MSRSKVHNNVYIPRESWPYWTWFAIEFFIVLTAATLTSNEIMGVLDESKITEPNRIWIFWSLVGIFFFVWYMLLRRLILRKKILENRHFRS